MPNTTISPDMNMPIPVVGVDTGPDWATNINACLNIVDSHNHSTGQGVQITPDGINISADLPFFGNNATSLRSVRFSSQGTPLSGGADVGCLYEVFGDLYYNDNSGNKIRITALGAVTGATGTITGLPSGTASASYAAGTFTFQSATNTPASMSFGPIRIAQQVVNGKGVTITPSVSQASDYNYVLPIALPTTLPALLQTDTSGNLSSSLTITQGTLITFFTFDNSGGTTAAKTVRYQVIGDWVTIFFPADITATSGTASTVLTSNSSLPILIRPLTSAQASLTPDMLDNGVLVPGPGVIAILTSGIIQIQRDSTNSWTTGTRCGPLDAFSFTYYIGTGS